MPPASQPDWPTIRARADLFPDQAFDFVREGLAHTSRSIHGEAAEQQAGAGSGLGGMGSGASGVAGGGGEEDSRHVSPQQLCLGLRDLALKRYGLLAPTVLRRWGIRRTDDFGVIVYAMIDRKEMRCSDEDRIDDFAGVFDFDEAFAPEHACGLS